MIATIGYAARHAGDELAAIHLDRRDPGPKGVHIQVLWCGICLDERPAHRAESRCLIAPTMRHYRRQSIFAAKCHRG
jgi:hypothetical protein